MAEHAQKQPESSRPWKKWILPVALVGAIVVAVAGVALWEFHEEPQFCSTFCHMMEPYVASWNGSDSMAHAHGQAGVTCLHCHEPTIQEQLQELAIFVSGDYQLPLNERQFEIAWCLRCHEHDSYLSVAERTRDYTVSGIVVNPHQRTVDFDNLLNPHATGKGEIECQECHKAHRESPGIEYCYGCHHCGQFTGCEECHQQVTLSAVGE